MNMIKDRIYNIIDDNVKDGSDWCFIFAPPKCGKTLLRNIINHHQDVSLITEAWLWGYIDSLLKRNVFLEYPDDGYETTGGSGKADIRNDEFIIQCRENTGFSGNGWPASAIREIMEGYKKAIAPNIKVFGEERRLYA